MTRYMKFIVALVGAIATWGITAAEDNTYTQVELWGALLALATAGGVYAVPNRAPFGQRPDPGISEQGHGDRDTLIWVIIAALVVLILLVLLDRV